MSSQVTNYQCPSCTGPLRFDGASGKLQCEYCGNSFTTEEIEKIYQAKLDEAEQAAVEASAERNLLFAACGVGALVGKVKLKLAGRQFQEGGFPTAVLEDVVGIIDKDFLAPSPAFVGASAQTDTKASVFGIRLGRAGIVAYDDGAVGELDEVGHAVGRVVGIRGDEGRRGPRPALIGGEADLDAAALAASQEPSVAQFNHSRIPTAAEDGNRVAGIPKDAAAVVAGYGRGVGKEEGLEDETE